MTKNELYNALLDEGENLPPIDKIKKAELEALYAQRHPEEAEQAPEPEKSAEDRPLDALEQQDAESAEAEPEAEQAPEDEPEKEAEQAEEAAAPVAPVELPPLHFSCAGWCAALNRSYFIGWYHPTSRAEYEALAPFADGACND